MGRECETGCSGTGAKFPAIWTRGSAVLGRGWWRSWETRADSTRSRAVDAAFWKRLNFLGRGFVVVRGFVSFIGVVGLVVVVVVVVV